MVVVVLLSVIVLALMAVFNSTQTAFRAGVTIPACWNPAARRWI